MFATVATKLTKADPSLLPQAEYDSFGPAFNQEEPQTYQSRKTKSKKPLKTNDIQIITNPSICQRMSSFQFRRECPVISIFVLYTLLTFLFAFIGGIVFHVCEYETENTEILQKRELYQQILNVLQDESDREKLDKLLNMCEIPLELGDNRWTIPKSAFFAFTTASTIGYGYTSPQTFWGRASTFIYGLPAIVIFGISMIQIGHAIVHRIDKGASQSYIGQLWSRIGISLWKCPCFRRCSVELQRTVCIFIILVFVVCFSAWSMAVLEEEWSFSDGCYFMWISISTIGYGDIEPSVIQTSYWANGLVWLGLSLTAILIGSTQDYFQMKVKYWRRERIMRRKLFKGGRVMLGKVKKDSKTFRYDEKLRDSKKENKTKIKIKTKKMLKGGEHEIQSPK
eukprot:137390_1